ncbi:MAG: hypothetical protein A2Y78_11270 [Acidobacteria bacterium RBG_13_68_16]|nr:MAG: hypothetical protein A2Y78_11270 [Acidobacteria bacterium RBG_13_68_16]
MKFEIGGQVVGLRTVTGGARTATPALEVTLTQDGSERELFFVSGPGWEIGQRVTITVETSEAS